MTEETGFDICNIAIKKIHGSRKHLSKKQTPTEILHAGLQL